MIGRTFKRSALLTLVAFGVVSVGGVGWKREELAAWYYTARLAGSDANDRDYWVSKVRSLRDGGMPRLLYTLRKEDAKGCANCRAALSRLFEDCRADAERTDTILDALAGGFASFSGSGQEAVLGLVEGLGESSGATAPDDRGQHALARILRASAPVEADRKQALALASRLISLPVGEELCGAIREILKASVRDPRAELRLDAIRLASSSQLNLPGLVVPLLADKTAEVRRAALLVVGSAPDIVSTDDLLPWLHDPDPEARQICEVALRGRGLKDQDLRLGRIISDPRPKSRLRLIELLAAETERAPGVWLRKLSHDPSPAVRVAAVRAACSLNAPGLYDRFEQIAHSDPSPTVRQVADYYFSRAPSAAGRTSR